MSQKLDLKAQKVLFVCLGNICRSPAAEGVLRSYLASQAALTGDKKNACIAIQSAGTADYHTGKPPDARMRSTAAFRGYELNSRAQSIHHLDLSKFDLIIAMDRDNLRDIHRAADIPDEKILLLSDFLDDSWPTDVPDPYYGEQNGFDYVLDMLEAAMPKIAEQLDDPRIDG